MSNTYSLFALLKQHFPLVSAQNWEMQPLSGLSGGSYLLRSQQTDNPIKLIARTDGKTQSALYVERCKEARILRQLHSCPFAPKVIGHNSQWLLLDWCDGQHPDSTTFVSENFQSHLAKTIAQLHCSPLLGYRLQLRDEIAHYGDFIDVKRFSPRWKRLHHHFLFAAMPKTLKLAPAHMDIHAKNIVCSSSGKLMLLDWEYAANTDIAFSLETYFQFNRLTDKQRHFFLTQYCDIAGAYRNKQQLNQHCKLWAPWVKYMTLMWYEVQWNESHAPHFLLKSQSLRQDFGLLA